MRRILLLMTGALLGFSCAAINANETSFPNAHASDPARIPWRVGAPPPD